MVSFPEPISIYDITLSIPSELYFPGDDTDLLINELRNLFSILFNLNKSTNNKKTTSLSYDSTEKDDNYKNIITNYKKHINWKLIRKDTIRICEIGVGPGSVSLFLYKYLEKIIIKECKINLKLINFLEIFGVDINPIAVEASKYNSKLNNCNNNIKFYLGDLFSAFKNKKKENKKKENKKKENKNIDSYSNRNKIPLGLIQQSIKFENTAKNNIIFDLIIFNPPYLAGEEDLINNKTRKIEDLTWEGGFHGYELTLRFLEESIKFTSSNTLIFLISSSLIDQIIIKKKIKNLGLKIVKTSKKHIFFEDIILYILADSHSSL